MVQTSIINIEENKSWERVKVHAVLLMRYMCKATDSLLMICEEIYSVNEGVVIPVQV